MNGRPQNVLMSRRTLHDEASRGPVEPNIQALRLIPGEDGTQRFLSRQIASLTQPFCTLICITCLPFSITAAPALVTPAPQAMLAHAAAAFPSSSLLDTSLVESGLPDSAIAGTRLLCHTGFVRRRCSTSWIFVRTKDRGWKAWHWSSSRACATSSSAIAAAGARMSYVCI